MSCRATWSGSPMIGNPLLPWANWLRCLANSSAETVRGIAHRQQPVDRRPVGLIHDAMTVIILSLAQRRPAGDDADGIDADLAALLLREMPCRPARRSPRPIPARPA